MKRPNSVTAFGILNLVFGLRGLLSAGFGLISTNPAAQKAAASIVRIMHAVPAYVAWSKVDSPAVLLGSCMVIAGGIGLLRFEEWGRKLSIGYGIFALLLGLARATVHLVFIAPSMLEQAHRLGMPESTAVSAAAIAMCVGVIVALVYPTLLLVFMTKERIVLAFRHPSSPPPLP